MPRGLIALSLLTLALTACGQPPRITAPPAVLSPLDMADLPADALSGQAVQPWLTNNFALTLVTGSTTRLTVGDTRYVRVTYEVRNTTTTAKTNVTLIPSLTRTTYPNTPFSRLTSLSGADLLATLGTKTKPAHGFTPSGMVDPALASFVAFEEAEVAPLHGFSGVVNALPYGFVVSRANGSRTLGPGESGRVTMAFKAPAQADPLQSFSVLYAIATDSVTRVTRSPEEGNDLGGVQGRAVTANATTAVLIGPDAQTAPSPLVTKRLSNVRTAGPSTVSPPVAVLLEAAPPTNGAPTELSLSASTVTADTAGATVGTLTPTDPDQNETFTYTVDDARFEVVGNVLKLKAGQSVPPSPATVNISVTVRDSANNPFTKAFALTVTAVQRQPIVIRQGSGPDLARYDFGSNAPQSFTVSEQGFAGPFTLVTNSAPSVASASLVGGALTVTPLAAGETTLTIGDGAQTRTFTVGVTTATITIR